MAQVAAPPSVVISGPAPLLTVDDLLAMPDEGQGFELVEGKLVERKPMGAKAGKVTMRVGQLLSNYADAGHPGHVFSPETTFHCFGTAVNGRRGDVSFIHRSRMPVVPDGAITIPADLIVEVISPTDVAYDVNAKVRLYLRHGFGVVWVVWPEDAAVDVHAAGQRMRRAIGDDPVDAEPALPGFACPAAQFFLA